MLRAGKRPIPDTSAVSQTDRLDTSWPQQLDQLVLQFLQGGQDQRVHPREDLLQPGNNLVHGGKEVDGVQGGNR